MPKIVELILDVKDPGIISTNIPKVNEPVFFSDGTHSFGDGVTLLHLLPRFGGSISVGPNQVAHGNSVTGVIQGSNNLLFDGNDLYLKSGGYIFGDAPNPFIKLSYFEGTFIGYANQFVKFAQDIDFNVLSVSKFTIGNTLSLFTNNVQIGAGIPTFTSKSTLIDSVNNSVRLAIENKSLGNAALTETLYVGESSLKYAAYGRYNVNFSGNYAGTAIPLADSSYMIASANGANGSGVYVVQASTIYGLAGNTAGAYSFKQDANGFRVDTLANIDDVNVYPFQVGNLSWDNSKFNSTYFQLGNTAGALYLTPNGYPLPTIVSSTNQQEKTVWNYADNSVRFYTKNVERFALEDDNNGVPRFVMKNDTTIDFGAHVNGPSRIEGASISGGGLGFATSQHPGTSIIFRPAYVQTLKLEPTLSTFSTKVKMTALPVGNAGLVSGELYQDTAANVLANGDKVVAIKV